MADDVRKWNGEERRNGDIPGRVLVVEEQIRTLSKEFHSWSIGVNERLDAIVNKSSTNWPTIFAGGSLVLVLVGAIGAAWIAPITVGMSYQEKISTLQNNLIQEKFDHIRGEVEINTAHLMELQKQSTSANEKFKEIETQIGWMRDISNMQKVDSWTRMAILWQKVFPGTEMPIPTAPVIGPGKNAGN